VILLLWWLQVSLEVRNERRAWSGSKGRLSTQHMAPGGWRAAFQQARHRPLVSASTGGRVPVERPGVWRQRRTADQVHLTKALESGTSDLAM